MKRNFILAIAIFIAGLGLGYSQGDMTQSEKPWRFELEPSSFLFKGFGLHIGRALTKDNKFSLAFYAAATNIPTGMQQRIFSNINDNDMTRVGLQLSLNARYKIEILKGRETNPYIGLVTGWEYFNLTNPAKADLRVNVILLTPYVGGEIYLYKNILYLNPQLRSVTYINPQYSIENREETLKKVFLLPQVSVGFRF